MNRTAVVASLHDEKRATGGTHDFYRYPARFSPEFVRAVMGAYSEEGDLVLDPFMGGGTTIVEAMRMSRRAVGSDINSLAYFVTKAKTTCISVAQRQALVDRLPTVIAAAKLGASRERPDDVHGARNLDGSLWRIRETLSGLKKGINNFVPRSTKTIATAALLRTGQWALECNDCPPRVGSIRDYFGTAVRELSLRSVELGEALRGVPNYRTVVRHSKASELAKYMAQAGIGTPRLIITSPPYPGIHVLYHRWQIRGRKETNAPYWLAGLTDGEGESYYTFGGRHRSGDSKYFEELACEFSAIRSVCNSQTRIVQLVGFSDELNQLPHYLDAMRQAGFREIGLDGQSDDARRVWRTVPNRRWFTAITSRTAREVLLVHRVS